MKNYARVINTYRLEVGKPIPDGIDMGQVIHTTYQDGGLHDPHYLTVYVIELVEQPDTE